MQPNYRRRPSSKQPGPLARLAYLGIACSPYFVACSKNGDGPSEEAIARAEAAYLECMEELGITVESVSLAPDDVHVRILKGDYTEEEAGEASLYCEDLVQPILLEEEATRKKLTCDHQLSEESEVAGKLGIAFDDYDPAICQPDAFAWEQNVSPLIEERCGTCHSSEPAFGAPVSLTDYDELLMGDPGKRLVDRIAIRAAAHTMPPPTSAQLEHAELDLLVEWATCGEVHPDPSVGLNADRKLYAVEEPDNLKLPSFDLLADNFAVGRDTLDRYQCFAFDLPIDEARLMRRIQVSLDESRVLHHILVLHDPERVSDGDDSFRCEDWPRDDTPILWGWGPGGNAFDFAEGGLRIEPTDRVVVQIHYNNGAGLEDVRDNTGIRLFHGPTGGREWSMLTTGAEDFRVPEGPSIACGDVGPLPEKMRVLASFPHMHRLGAELHTTIHRANGKSEDLINLTGWNFEAQQFYATETILEPGDNVHTWCAFRNNSGVATTSGNRTDQEMCFNFLYISPE
jgi:hypothetical protein